MGGFLSTRKDVETTSDVESVPATDDVIASATGAITKAYVALNESNREEIASAAPVAEPVVAPIAEPVAPIAEPVAAPIAEPVTPAESAERVISLDVQSDINSNVTVRKNKNKKQQKQ